MEDFEFTEACWRARDGSSVFQSAVMDSILNTEIVLVCQTLYRLSTGSSLAALQKGWWSKVINLLTSFSHPGSGGALLSQ